MALCIRGGGSGNVSLLFFLYAWEKFGVVSKLANVLRCS